jgi:hypothetical protein
MLLVTFQQPFQSVWLLYATLCVKCCFLEEVALPLEKQLSKIFFPQGGDGTISACLLSTGGCKKLLPFGYLLNV